MRPAPTASASATASALRRRAALGALGIAAAIALTACGATAHPGAAAIVGDQRITTAALDSHLTAYRSALSSAAVQTGGGGTEAAGLVRHTLQLLVESRLVDDQLQAQGLTVSTAEVERARASAIQQTGSEQALEQVFLQQIGLAPGDIDEYFRMSVGEQKLLAAQGIAPTDQNASAAITAMLDSAAKQHPVSVNPRYGRWNPKEAAVAAATQPWIRTSTS
ncbi:SurA N-terminal domain-containing protein [Phaeacidiphilus oryzae]|uniref:SurA N-terminal domain-containing protein n=1 Tax=Phaeacidiphilus oryzae TaxID=348818 RepID=UPI000689328B|nr:SurA N-terminal domain-containing protein [Phaeacidiphilus oryzae]